MPKPLRYAEVINIRLIVSDRLPSVIVSNPRDAVEFCRPKFEGLAVEMFAALYLNSANGVLKFYPVSTGILNSSLVHPREVFAPACVAPAAGIILVHNHPSGNPEPSAEDIRITRQLCEAGKIMDIPVRDHIIITPGDGFTSFAERGLI